MLVVLLVLVVFSTILVTCCSFRIPRVARADSGLYSCVAGNILGETVVTASLQLSGAPPLHPAAALLTTTLLSLLWPSSAACPSQ